MEFEFVIPLKFDDLQTVTSGNHYHVSDIVSVNDLETKISECKEHLFNSGPRFILDHFDVLYSTLYNIKHVKFETLHGFYKDILLKALDSLDLTLATFLCEDGFSEEGRINILNSTKMICFIVVQFLKLFQEKLDSTYCLVIDKKGKKDGKLQKHIEEHNWDWEFNERLAFNYFHKILQHPLYKLWDPPVPEVDFVNLVSGSCYTMLEKPTITGIKLRPTKDTIFSILGILIKSYNHAINCKEKIVQLLKQHEHLASPLAQAVVKFIKELNCRSLMKEIIIEIIESGDTVLEGYSQDSSSIRTYSNFIVEIAEKEPEFILPCINLLTPSLNCDPYSMRICVLTVLTEIIIRVLKSDQLSDESRIMRDTFLDHLLDHILDINVFVRSKVLRLWQRMWEENAVPKHKIVALLEGVIQRLEDKSSQVVKYSIQLLRIMLENNIYGAKLDAKDVELRLTKLRSELVKLEEQEEKLNKDNEEIWSTLRPEILSFLRLKIFETETWVPPKVVYNEQELANKFKEIRNYIKEKKYEEAYSCIRNVENSFPETYQPRFQMDISDKIEYFCWLFHTIWKGEADFFKTKPDSGSEKKTLYTESTSIENNVVLDATAFKLLITYYEDFLKFIEIINKSVSVICELMLGDSPLEVLESIEFFVAAKRFEISGADEGVRKMLILIYSNDKTVRESVIAAYKLLYLNVDEITARAAAVKIISRLIGLLKTLTYEQKGALEHVIKQWVIDDNINQECILVLWEIYSNKFPNIKADDRRAATYILSMVSSGKIQVIKSNLDVLIKYGLGVDNCKDYLLVKYTCKIFKNLIGMKSESGVLVRYPANNELFLNLLSIIEEQFTDFSNLHYVEIAMDAISIIYELSESPDVTCEKLLKTLCKLTSVGRVDLTGTQLTMSEELLARFIFIIGHTAFSQWKYLEKDIFFELKRRNQLLHTQNNEKVAEKMKRKKVNKDLEEKEAQQAFENNEAVAEADHKVTEAIRNVCETELLYEDNLISKLWPIIVKVCENPSTYSGIRLRSAAVISLSKLMITSSVFCSNHMQLYFTILKKCDDPVVRTNLLLSFGDLSYRFPNLIEPWTYILYENLRDESVSVRYTTLTVISYLILNEMIKVKGQIADVAICMIDKNTNIKSLALQLFNELGSKVNVVYNIMPDIISQLSNPTENRITEENFQIIMKKLMSLIVKDRHFELLVEKLCHRLRGAVDERQSNDLSYCLTLINYSDRAVQKLYDNITCYADKLHETKVHKNFATIISNCKKAKLNKSQELVNELQQKIDIILTKGVAGLENNEEIAPLKTPMKTPHKMRRGQTPSSAQRSTRKTYSSVKRTEPDDDISKPAPVPRRTGRQVRKFIVEESSEDSDT